MVDYAEVPRRLADVDADGPVLGHDANCAAPRSTVPGGWVALGVAATEAFLMLVHHSFLWASRLGGVSIGRPLE